MYLSSFSEAQALAGAGPFHAACLLLMPWLRGILGVLSLQLHALRLLGCCLSSIEHRQPSIVLKELASFGKVAHVGICKHQSHSIRT